MNDFENIVKIVLNLQVELSKMEGIQTKTLSIEITEKADLYDLVITDAELRKYTRTLFMDGHHARAIEEGFKYLNNVVKKKSRLNNEDGASLMRKALNCNNPVLKLNEGVNVSERDEQQGYMDIFAGCMTGIRNPRAHEHEWEDTETRAIQLLSLANHLVEKIKLSEKI